MAWRLSCKGHPEPRGPMLVEVDVRMMRLCDRLLEAPDLFAPTLRTLHTAQDRRSAGFAITFVTNMISHPSELPDNLWELLVAHDLPPIVVDVATDPRTYTATDPDDMPHYILAMLVLLDPALEHLRVHIRQSSNIDISKYLLEKLPQLWKNIWDHKDILLSKRIAFSRRVGQHHHTIWFNLAKIICSHGVLHTLCYPGTSLPDTDLGFRIALYCWLHTSNPFEGTMALDIVCGFASKQTPATMRRFFKESILETFGPARFIEKVVSQLENVLIVDGYLCRVLWILEPVFVYCPEVLEACAGHSKGRLVRLICRACKRELCSSITTDEIEQGPLSLGSSTETISVTLAKGLRAVRVLLEAGARPGRFEQFFIMEDCMALFPLISCCASLGVDPKYSFLQSATMSVLDDYALAINIYRRKRNQGPELSDQLRRLCCFEHEIWSPTLRLLRQHTSSQVEAWIHFGLFIGFREGNQASDCSGCLSEGRKQAFTWAGRKGCHYSDCLCHGPCEDKNLHKMRVCKGCWSVYYCSNLCQSRDWQQGGHKRRCARYRRATGTS